MNNSPISRAAAAAEITLLLSVAALLGIIYLATTQASPSPVVLILVSLALASTLVLHLTFVALLARRAGRSATWFTVGALLTFPLGSAVALILYEWHVRVDSTSAKRAA